MAAAEQQGAAAVLAIPGEFCDAATSGAYGMAACAAYAAQAVAAVAAVSAAFAVEIHWLV